MTRRPGPVSGSHGMRDVTIVYLEVWARPAASPSTPEAIQVADPRVTG